MAKSISDLVIVITGASSGIGRATALAAADQKASVVLVSRQEAALEEVARECERLGGNALTVRADVTSEKEVLHVAALAIDRFGRIDAWVNAAAVSLLSGFEDAPSDAFRRVVETNFFGYVHGARAALAQFRRQGNGVLINISSVLGKIGAPYASAYSASKFAVVGFSESLRMELQNAPEIHVCTIFPATVDTPLFQHAANYTGRAVAAPPPVYQPETVAAAILKCILKPVREVSIGNMRRTIGIRTLAPGMAERMYAIKVHKKHFLDRPAPASHGNLFDSMPGYNTVHGGWSNGGSRRHLWFGAALVGVLAGVAAIYFTQRRRTQVPSKEGSIPDNRFQSLKSKALDQLRSRAQDLHSVAGVLGSRFAGSGSRTHLRGYKAEQARSQRSRSAIA